MDEHNADLPSAIVIAVPDDAVADLVDAGFVQELLILRGPVVDAVINVGVDAAALVTLLQTPAMVHGFATWLADRARQRKDSIKIVGRHAGRRVEMIVTGDVPIRAITDFVLAAFPDAADEGESDNGR